MKNQKEIIWETETITDQYDEAVSSETSHLPVVNSNFSYMEI